MERKKNAFIEISTIKIQIMGTVNGKRAKHILEPNKFTLIIIYKFAQAVGAVQQ